MMNQLNVDRCHKKQKNKSLDLALSTSKKNLSKRHRKSGVFSTDALIQRQDSESDQTIPIPINAELSELDDPVIVNRQIRIDIEKENGGINGAVFEQINTDKDRIDRGH
jgi:hypothetical protein